MLRAFRDEGLCASVRVKRAAQTFQDGGSARTERDQIKTAIIRVPQDQWARSEAGGDG